MTKLVLDPGKLKDIFKDATISNVYKVRIIAQIVQYRDRDSRLVVTKMRNVSALEDEEFEPINLSVDIHDIIDTLEPETIQYGAVVNIFGYWDGHTLKAFQCYTINGQALLPSDNIQTLIKMCCITDLESN